jgi:hypothetical protein
MSDVIFGSHVNSHGLDEALLSLIERQFPNRVAEVGVGKVAIATYPLPEGVKLRSDLYGPAEGDTPVTDAQVIPIDRGEGRAPSRGIDLPPRPANHVVVIGAQFEVDGPVIVFTAYGSRSGIPAPKELDDPHLTPEERPWAELFWKNHALSTHPFK